MASLIIRSISFDTSFLLMKSPTVDKVIKNLEKDGVKLFMTSTVISELEQLKIWGRISERDYNIAMSRWKRLDGKVIDVRNKLVKSALNQECIITMGVHHGVAEKDIVNDCSIIVTGLKNGVDLFLSEDFHFTSKVSVDALKDIASNACREFGQICDREMYAVDSQTFNRAYRNGKVDMNVIEKSRKPRRKAGK